MTIEDLYVYATGRKLSRSGDPHAKKIGPSSRFMSSVWTLAGVKRPPHSIIKDLREYTAWRRSTG
jgi:hypothetical protein